MSKQDEIAMKRWNLQEEHRELMFQAMKAKQAVEEEAREKIKGLEKAKKVLLAEAEEVKGYLGQLSYSPQFFEFTDRLKVAAQRVKEENRLHALEEDFKEKEREKYRVTLALEGIYQDSESIKERITALEDLHGRAGGKADFAAMRAGMEQIWREREGRLEAALEKEKEARDQEVSQTQELLAHAAKCKAELAAAKQDFQASQGATSQWKRGFENLWHQTQDLRKHHRNMRASIEQRLASEMAELQQKSAALLALLSVILPLTDQLRDLVESPVGEYIQNRVDMTSGLIDMPKLQHQLLELDSLRKKCMELNLNMYG